MKPVVAIVGRPNVGKSTLFNRLVGGRRAIVDDTPGVTRDRHYAEAEHEGRTFTVMDTGGFDPEAEEGMTGLMRRQVEIALAEADALIVVVDAREGLNPVDEAVWRAVAAGGCKAFLAVNKVDGPEHVPLAADFYRLGVEELFEVSAQNGSGVAELVESVLRCFDDAGMEDERPGKETPIRVAIIGRPNVGKSTFANALLGDERYLTSEKAGTTVDAVDTPFQAGGRRYVLIDTAGIRRRRNVERGIERAGVSRAVRAMERSHVAALVMDASEGVTDQDKKLAALAIERGRGLVLVLNKWDLVEPSPRAGDTFARMLADEMPFASFAPHLFVSAIEGRNVGKFPAVAARVHENLFARIPTSRLNEFYREVVQARPPTISGTRTARIRYLTQVQVDPPTILLFKGGSAQVPRNYVKFIENRLRERFGFEGVPIRLIPK